MEPGPDPASESSAFRASFPSGLDSNGVSNGLITWRAHTAAGGVLIDSLALPGIDYDAEDHFFLDGTEYHENGTRLQYKTDTQLFDAESANDSLTLRFFDTADLGNKTDGFYNPSSGLMKTIVYQKTGDAIAVSKTEGGSTSITHLIEWNAGSVSWTDLPKARKLVTLWANVGSHVVVTNEEWSAENSAHYVLTSRVAREYEPFGQDGFRLVSITRHGDTAGTDLRVETLVYGAGGEVERRHSNDGSWSVRTSGGDGRFDMETGDTALEVTYTPWLDAAYPASGLPAAEDCVARVERKRVVGTATVDITEVHTAGILTARTERHRVASGTSGYREETVRQFTGDGHYLDTVTLTHPASDPDNPGKVFRRTDPAGTTITYTYANFALDEATGNFSQDAEGTYPGTYTTEGTAASPEGVLDGEGKSRTTRTLVIRDASGRAVRRETQAYLGGGTYETMTYTSYNYALDLNGRVLSTTTIRDGRTIAFEERNGSGTTLSTGEDGVWETVTTDISGRLSSIVRPGLTITHFQYPLSTTVMASASGLPDRITFSTVNLLGETTSTTDETGTVTHYSRDHAARTHTTTRNGVTVTSTRYADGGIKSESGNGTVPTYTTRAIDPATGFLVTTHSEGESNTHGPRFRSTVTDWTGRTRTETRPGPPIDDTNRHPDLVTTYLYDPDTGRLARTEASAGPSPVLHFSDVPRTASTQGLDVDGDDALDPADGDRFTSRRTFYRKDGGQWWRVTETTRHITATVAEITETATLMSAADGETTIATRRIGATFESATTTTRTFDPANLATTTTFDGPGGQHISTETVLPDGGRLVETTVPDIAHPADPGQSGLEIHLYDAYGRLVRHTDPRGATTTSFHYGAGHLLERVTDQLGRHTNYTYYPPAHANAGLFHTVTTPGGGVITYGYDLQGRLTSVGGNAEYPREFGYTLFGELETLDTFGTQQATTTWHHDPATGLLTFKEYHGGKGTRHSYTADGKPHIRTWESGVTTTRSYQPATGDLTAIAYSDATPSVTFSGHDLLGRPGTVTENRPGSITDTTTLSYDSVSGAETAAYAANHSVLPGVTLEARDPDEHGHPTGHLVKLGGNTIHGWEFENDPFGRITGVASGDVTVAIEPQPGTRHIRERVTRVNGQIVHRSTRGIDMLGRVTGMVTRAPDPDNGGTLRILASAGHQHDPSGRRKNTRREDGTKWEYGYNDRSEVTSAVKTSADSQLVPGLSFGYQFDGMGNRITSTAGTAPNAAVTHYTPDALNQYEQITTPGDLHILARSDDPVTIEIDGTPATITSVGNLHGAHATVDNSTGGAYPEIEIDDGTITRTGHRWIAPATVEPEYDFDGNLEQDGRWIYHWDAEHRLVKLETLATAIAAGAPALTIEYTYDWRSRRIREKVTEATTVTHDQRTLYDHWNPVANFTIENSTFVLQHSLLWGPDLSGTLQGAGGVGGLLLVTCHLSLGTDGYHPSYDTNGNIIAWSDSTGKLVRRLDYGPFGNTVIKETLSGDETALDAILRHGFSTKPADPQTGLLYYGYRWLDPVNGRWISRDPIEEEGGLNLYGFVANSGIASVDYLGLAWSVERKGEERATVCGEKGDTIEKLARITGHDSSDFREWLVPLEEMGLPSNELTETRKFSIPNVWIWSNLLQGGKGAWNRFVEVGPRIAGITKPSSRIYKVIDPTTPDELHDVLMHFGKSLHGFTLYAHGTPDGRITSDVHGTLETHQNILLRRFLHIDFRVPRINLMQCYSLFQGFYTLSWKGDDDKTRTRISRDAKPLPGQRIGVVHVGANGRSTWTRYFDWKTPWESEGVKVKGYSGVNAAGLDMGIRER